MPRLALPALLLAALVAITPVRAADQGEARRAVESGEIRPLDEVLRAVRTAVPGDVVKLDLKRDDGHWFYKLKILTPEGRRREVKIDARTLAFFDEDDDDDDDD